MQITASTLYNLVECPTRVARDFHGDPVERDEINPFVSMLWERGTLYERDVIREGELEYVDLSELEVEEKEHRTLEAMHDGEKLIYSGRIVAGRFVGVPDLLRKQGQVNSN